MLFGLIPFFFNLKYVILQLGVDGNQISCKKNYGKYLLKITLNKICHITAKISGPYDTNESESVCLRLDGKGYCQPLRKLMHILYIYTQNNFLIKCYHMKVSIFDYSMCIVIFGYTLHTKTNNTIYWTLSYRGYENIGCQATSKISSTKYVCRCYIW